MQTVMRLACVMLAAAVMAPRARAETSELKVTKQPGALYAAMLMMEHDKLVEKHAAKLGHGELKVTWGTLMSGGAGTDAILSGNIDIVTSGVSNMLILWGKTNGAVKGLAGVSGLPFKLVTRNPDVKTIKDFGPKDRIAVPTVRLSMQAITLGIALQKAWGDEKANEKLLTNQIQLGHPDALAALLNPVHEVNAHFSTSPFQEIALKNPSIHTVLESRDALGGDAHVAITFATQKFYDANPKTVRAFVAALEEASAMVREHPLETAKTYLTMVKERVTAEELAAIFTQPGAIYKVEPTRTMVYATYMAKAGFIKPEPKSWKEYFFPLLHDRDGS